jgi:glutamate N-acetyltransferase/amino-acid N-acetyltransferase
MSPKTPSCNEPPALLRPLGFTAGGVHAAVKPSGALDLGAILCGRPAVTAAVTTTNLFCGAPVTLCRERIASSPHMRGVIVNSGNANTATGKAGLRHARAMATRAEASAGAEAGQFLVCSTGVIGVALPIDRIMAATPELIATLSVDGWEDFARSIMTTDTVAKLSSRAIKLRRGREGRILGVAKGSGMIHPNMATMLAFIATDYPLAPAQARRILKRVVDGSFNCISVDGDQSTSDTVILMSSRAALNRREVTGADDKKFEAALAEVAQDLARAIARDGEGATKLITIEVAGARHAPDARQIARAVANSSLVKTALFGNDPNWGRICCAAGYSGALFEAHDFSLKLQGQTLMRRGLPVRFDPKALRRALDAPEIMIQIKVGGGKGSARMWTCDLTYDYVKINAQYTT